MASELTVPLAPPVPDEPPTVSAALALMVPV
jgi:hypothetical protein